MNKIILSYNCEVSFNQKLNEIMKFINYELNKNLVDLELIDLNINEFNIELNLLYWL